MVGHRFDKPILIRLFDLQTILIRNRLKMIRRKGIILVLVLLLTLVVIQMLKYNGLQFFRRKWKVYNERISVPINSTEPNRVNERKIVVVVGQARTGTTLLGDLFNNMDDFIYFFEPLRYARHLTYQGRIPINPHSTWRYPKVKNKPMKI